MRATLLRKKTIEELNIQLKEKQKELSDLRFDLKIGKEKNAARVKAVKKDVARILTVLNETSTVEIVDKSVKIDETEKDNN